MSDLRNRPEHDQEHEVRMSSLSRYTAAVVLTDYAAFASFAFKVFKTFAA